MELPQRRPTPLRTTQPVAPAGRPLTAPEPRDIRPIGGKAALVVFLLICGALMFAVAQHILKSGPVMLTPRESEDVAGEPAEKPLASPIQLLGEQDMLTPEAAAPEPIDVASAPEAEPVAHESTTFELVVTGARVEEKGGDLVVTFDNGIFSKVDQLRPYASDALQDLARQLAPYGDRVTVLVTGHTDNEPVPKNRPYKTNYDLGMLRALAVANHLIEHAGMPRSIVSTRSLGAQDAPYPNDTAENRAKNRTVVITIRM